MQTSVIPQLSISQLFKYLTSQRDNHKQQKLLSLFDKSPRNEMNRAFPYVQQRCLPLLSSRTTEVSLFPSSDNPRNKNFRLMAMGRDTWKTALRQRAFIDHAQQLELVNHNVHLLKDSGLLNSCNQTIFEGIALEPVAGMKESKNRENFFLFVEKKFIYIFYLIVQ